jgi:hypothetical protein
MSSMSSVRSRRRVPTVQPGEILRQPLRNQRLVGRPFRRQEEVVAWLGAVQALDYDAAKWGIGQRTETATDADLDRLCDAASILRTHVMRPTWHFVTPGDIRWLLALAAPRSSTRWWRDPTRRRSSRTS